MTCRTCDGAGLVLVGDEYIDMVAPMPGLLELGKCETDAEREELTRQALIKRASARNSVYPCRDCNPKAFHRWREGYPDPPAPRTSEEPHPTSTWSERRDLD